MEANGGRICLKCDHALVSFQHLENVIKEKLQLDEKADTIKTKEENQTEPASKKKKITTHPITFAVNDKVMYFDKKNGKLAEGVVTKIVTEEVCLIGVRGLNPFHMNTSYLTKC